MNKERKTEIKEKYAFHLFVQQNFIAALKMFRSVETGQHPHLTCASMNKGDRLGGDGVRDGVRVG